MSTKRNAIRVSTNPQSYFIPTKSSAAAVRVWQRHRERATTEVVELTAGKSTTIDWKKRVQNLKKYSFNEIMLIFSDHVCDPAPLNREELWATLPACGVGGRGLGDLCDVAGVERYDYSSIPRPVETTNSNQYVAWMDHDIDPEESERGEELGNATTKRDKGENGEDGYLSPDPGNCMCGRVQSGTMISCDQCDEWYHLTCMNFTEEEVPSYWACPRCVRKEKRFAEKAAGEKDTKEASSESTPEESSVPNVKEKLTGKKRKRAEKESDSVKKVKKTNMKKTRLCRKCKQEVFLADRKAHPPTIYRCKSCNQYTHLKCGKSSLRYLEGKGEVEVCPECCQAIDVASFESLDVLASAVEKNQWVPPTAESATWTSMAQGSTTTQSFLSGHNFLSGSLPSGARYTAALPLSNSADAASTIMTTTASTAAAAVTTLQPSRAPTPSLGKNLLKKIFKHSNVLPTEGSARSASATTTSTTSECAQSVAMPLQELDTTSPQPVSSPRPPRSIIEVIVKPSTTSSSLPPGTQFAPPKFPSSTLLQKSSSYLPSRPALGAKQLAAGRQSSTGNDSVRSKPATIPVSQASADRNPTISNLLKPKHTVSYHQSSSTSSESTISAVHATSSPQQMSTFGGAISLPQFSSMSSPFTNWPQSQSSMLYSSVHNGRAPANTPMVYRQQTPEEEWRSRYGMQKQFPQHPQTPSSRTSNPIYQSIMKGVTPSGVAMYPGYPPAMSDQGQMNYSNRFEWAKAAQAPFPGGAYQPNTYVAQQQQYLQPQQPPTRIHPPDASRAENPLRGLAAYDSGGVGREYRTSQ